MADQIAVPKRRRETNPEAYQRGFADGRLQGYQQALRDTQQQLDVLLAHISKPKLGLSDAQDTLSIKDLNFDTRIENALRREGITTLGKLLRTSKQEIGMFRGLGPVAVEQIEQRVVDMGFTLMETVVARLR